MSDWDFPLKKQVPSRELCEQLRDAGFPQNTVWCWETCEGKPEHVALTLRNRQVAGGVYVAAPLVGEMREWLRQQKATTRIEAPRAGGGLYWYPTQWTHYPDGQWSDSQVSWYGWRTDADAHALACLALLKAMKEEKS